MLSSGEPSEWASIPVRSARSTRNECSKAGARIRETWTQYNYGGRRPWFICPRGGCGRRVAILHGGTDFGCRTCRRLTYGTQRVPPASRSLDRAQRLRVRLGGSVDMTQPFPARPKGMHQLTYMKHAMRAWRAEDKANAETRDWVNAVLGVRQ